MSGSASSAILLPQRLDVGVRREQVDEQDVAGLQLGLRGRAPG